MAAVSWYVTWIRVESTESTTLRTLATFAVGAERSWRVNELKRIDSPRPPTPWGAGTVSKTRRTRCLPAVRLVLNGTNVANSAPLIEFVTGTFRVPDRLT